MTQKVSLGWGRAPLTIDVPDDARIVALAPAPPARPLEELLRVALASPIGAPRLRERARGLAAEQVVVIVSDGTRDEPRRALLEAVRDELALPAAPTIAIANGTHAPRPLEELGLPSWATRVMNHDGWDDAAFVEMGQTARGTRVRFPRWLLDAALVVATGRIRPHYFAGFGAGAKAVFPGLGQHADIRANHLLKADPTSRLGVVSGNACRDDLEEAAQLLGVDTFLLNVVLDDDGGAQAAVAGDLQAAFRRGAEHARALFGVPVAPAAADVVVVSARIPVAASLYQASKLLAPAAVCLRTGGVVVLAAECHEGTGPIDTVNRGIYELGLRRLFPGAHTIYLVSSLPEALVRETYCRFADRVEDVLARHAGDVFVLPRAESLLPMAESP